jgi:hypothetical protein
MSGEAPPARTLDSSAIALAVIASIRHEDTPYDELLMSGIDRHEARAQVRHEVDRVLASWVARA